MAAYDNISVGASQPIFHHPRKPVGRAAVPPNFFIDPMLMRKTSNRINVKTEVDAAGFVDDTLPIRIKREPDIDDNDNQAGNHGMTYPTPGPRVDEATIEEVTKEEFKRAIDFASPVPMAEINKLNNHDISPASFEKTHPAAIARHPNVPHINNPAPSTVVSAPAWSSEAISQRLTQGAEAGEELDLSGFDFTAALGEDGDDAMGEEE
jgi:hypothetical protein